MIEMQYITDLYSNLSYTCTHGGRITNGFNKIKIGQDAPSAKELNLKLSEDFKVKNVKFFYIIDNKKIEQKVKIEYLSDNEIKIEAPRYELRRALYSRKKYKGRYDILIEFDAESQLYDDGTYIIDVINNVYKLERVLNLD